MHFKGYLSVIIGMGVCCVIYAGVFSAATLQHYNDLERLFFVQVWEFLRVLHYQKIHKMNTKDTLNVSKGYSTLEGERMQCRCLEETLRWILKMSLLLTENERLLTESFHYNNILHYVALSWLSVFRADREQGSCRMREGRLCVFTAVMLTAQSKLMGSVSQTMNF